ncbi:MULTISPECIES: hypothetical protein [unclassified Streptomyces]|uniref:hypothetical protein n=1 Tax=unclassified Streptomyces TaxID=2593676 RepID=UPI001CBE8999|nr:MULTISPECIES: hypothetical protein [unclassified Streptomyces]WPO71003.1 hypothetical protein R9806_10395 [Streptomyces sp. KN37]
MAWDEWERLKTEAADSRRSQMQLNQAPAASGHGNDGDLVVRRDDLGAVGHEAFILHDQLGKQADIAGAGTGADGAGSTLQAASALTSHNFSLGTELETTVSLWDSQLKTLRQACAHISNHLDYSKALHTQNDVTIAASIRHRDGSAESVSRISDYFK